MKVKYEESICIQRSHRDGYTVANIFCCPTQSTHFYPPRRLDDHQDVQYPKSTSTIMYVWDDDDEYHEGDGDEYITTTTTAITTITIILSAIFTKERQNTNRMQLSSRASAQRGRAQMRSKLAGKQSGETEKEELHRRRRQRGSNGMLMSRRGLGPFADVSQPRRQRYCSTQAHELIHY